MIKLYNLYRLLLGRLDHTTYLSLQRSGGLNLYSWKMEFRENLLCNKLRLDILTGFPY